MKKMYVILSLGLFCLSPQNSFASPSESEIFISKFVNEFSSIPYGRYTDSDSIEASARYLIERLKEQGIEGRIEEYNPLDLFANYRQSIDRTYRQYLEPKRAEYSLDFHDACEAEPTNETTTRVRARLARVGLSLPDICAIEEGSRFEFYLSRSVDFSTSQTLNLISNRSKLLWPNVVATIEPDDRAVRDTCVVGAHFDSIARVGGSRGPVASPGTPSPGADDNASGSGAILFAISEAKLWTKILNCRLEFVWFSGEEMGLFGSLAYIQKSTDLKNIRWMLNVDMIGYDGKKANKLNLGYDIGKSLEMKDQILKNVPSLDTNVVAVAQSAHTYSSDQLSFTDVGIPSLVISEAACLSSECSEEYGNFNPYFHTPDDTGDKLDFAYAGRITAYISRVVFELAATDR